MCLCPVTPVELQVAINDALSSKKRIGDSGDPLGILVGVGNMSERSLKINILLTEQGLEKVYRCMFNYLSLKEPFRE